MAQLQSPGVSVSVIDESFYTPAGAGTVPMVFVATGQDKENGSGTGTAIAVTANPDVIATFDTAYAANTYGGQPNPIVVISNA